MSVISTSAAPDPAVQPTQTGALAFGVAGRVGARLGLDPALVRGAFVVGAFAGGVGVVIYAGLALAPRRWPEADRPASHGQHLAAAAVLVGLLLLCRSLGLWAGDAVVWPVAVAASGSTALWVGDTTARRRPARVVVSVASVVGAIAWFLAERVGSDVVWEVALTGLVTAAGLTLLAGPLLLRFGRDARAERDERIRGEERASIAAHLHDSVLQTLTLLQRETDPQRVSALARQQERELRSWLYGGREVGATRLVDAVDDLVSTVESRHGIRVESIVVGDDEIGEEMTALLGAVRESLVNAANHASVVTADLYVEVRGSAVEAFVRDRGVGFDVAEATEGRGIRHSITDRLARVGGTSEVVSIPGVGTEVRLSVPRPEPVGS